MYEESAPSIAHGGRPILCVLDTRDDREERVAHIAVGYHVGLAVRLAWVRAQGKGGPKQELRLG